MQCEAVCTGIRGKRYHVPVAPEIVDSAEEGWAFVCFQPLAHWNGEGLLLPLTPRCLRRILKAKVPSAVGLHFRWKLVAPGTRGPVKPLGMNCRRAVLDGSGQFGLPHGRAGTGAA